MNTDETRIKTNYEFPLNWRVAIRVTTKYLAERKELCQRFEWEAREIAALNPPHICALYDIGSHEGVAK
jgi:hypothetical protein